MDDTRKRLYELLLEITGYSGRIYYNPPENVKLSYPCVVYSLDDITSLHADGLPYLHVYRYSVLHICKSVEQESMVGRLADHIGFDYSNSYRKDGLIHTVFSYSVFSEEKTEEVITNG